MARSAFVAVRNPLRITTRSDFLARCLTACPFLSSSILLSLRHFCRISFSPMRKDRRSYDQSTL